MIEAPVYQKRGLDCQEGSATEAQAKPLLNMASVEVKPCGLPATLAEPVALVTAGR